MYSAIINSHIEDYNQPNMKITLTSKHTVSNSKTGSHTSRFFLGLSIVCCFLLNTVSLNAQGEASISTVLAHPTVSEWKSHKEYFSVITAEKANTTKKLADASLQGQERVVYIGFDRMLTDILTDLATQEEVASLADKNYKKLIAESQSDPALQNMSIADFNALYDSLVVKLHE